MPTFRRHGLDAVAHPYMTLLAARRVKSGLSQSAVARMLGTTQSTVSNMEAGCSKLGLTLVARYAALMGLQLALFETDGLIVKEEDEDGTAGAEAGGEGR